MFYKFVNTRTKAIIFIADLVGFLLWAVFHLLTLRPWKIIPFRKVPQSPKRVLLVRCDYIGDVLLTTHTLRAIRERFPSSELHFLVSEKSREILDGNPYVDGLITYSPPWFFSRPGGVIREYLKLLSLLRSRRFDLAADFRGDLRNIFFLMVLAGVPHRVSFSASGGWYLLTKRVSYDPSLHEAEYHSRIASALGALMKPNDLPKLFIGPEDRKRADEFIGGLPQPAGRLAVIQPGARKAVRRWPLERYAEVGRFLISAYGAKVILAGAPDERDLLFTLKGMIGEGAYIPEGRPFTFRELAAFFEKCFVYVGVSSGPSHIAASVGLQSVLLFGPEKISQWQPLGNRCYIVKKEFPCCPCDQKSCPIMEKNCIMAIGAKDVINGINWLLGPDGRDNA